MQAREKAVMISALALAVTVLLALLAVYGRLCIVETNVAHLQQEVAEIKDDVKALLTKRTAQR